MILAKIIICPLIVLLVDLLSGDVNYHTFSQPLMVGVVLALTGRLTEYLILQHKAVWISTVVDFFISAAVVYGSQYFFPESEITVFGVLVTALLLSVAEHLQHLLFVQRAQREKNQP